MKITKRQLQRIIKEYHPRPDDDYDPLNPDEFGRESPEDDMDYDRGLEAGCYGWPRDTGFGPAYDDGYDQGEMDAKDPDSECNREHAEEFGPSSPGMMGPPRRESVTKITKRQLQRIVKEEKTKLLQEKWGGMGEEPSGSALIHFAKAYAKLGPQVQEQVEALVSAYFNNFPATGFVSHEEIMANPDFEDVAMQQNPAAIEMARKTMEYTNFSGVDAHEELLHMDDALEVALKLLRGEEEEEVA